MAEQQLILVDKDDSFLDKYAPKSQCHLGKGLHHRGFTVFIYDKKGEVLLQKRKHKLWDNIWDLTNSHPLHKQDKDETYEEAVKRCLKREWGIKVPVRRASGFNYFARNKAGNFCENEYCALFVGEYNSQVYPNPEVAYGHKWLLFSKLLEDIKLDPHQYTPWLILAVRKLPKRFVIPE